MITRKVIYSESQHIFYNDIRTNIFIDKMLASASLYDFKPSNSELNSWRNNGPKIKDLLELSGVENVFVTFEYLVPYSKKRIDCMLYGKDLQGHGTVIHIELKQWDNNSVHAIESDGNFEITAYTGGSTRIVSHPSQQVRGYNDYLTGFIDVLSTKELNIEGFAYCYNYRRKQSPNDLYASIYETLQHEYHTFSGDDTKEIAARLQILLGKGDGLEVFNKMIHSPIRPSRKLLDSAASLIHEGNISEFALIEDQIVARNIILDKIRKIGDKKSVIIVKGGPGTGKTVIALHILALLAQSKKTYNIRYATKSKPLLEGVKNKLPRGSKAKLLFANVTQFLPANYDENNIDVLLIDEAHRIAKSANNQYTPAQKRTELSQIQTIIRSAKISVFFIDDKQAIRSLEIGSSTLIKECAAEFHANLVEIELKSQFRCNGSDNYLDWLEQVLYNEPIQAHFSKEEYDFRIYDDPKALYDTILHQNNIKGKSARLTAGFCWPWSDQLDANNDLIKDVQIGAFAMPWETKDSLPKIPSGYVKWYEWAYKPEGIKQVGCIYTAQGFEFDYIGVIIGPDMIYNSDKNCIETDISKTKDPMLKRDSQNFDWYVRNIYRVLMSRGMKGCYIYCCDKALSDYLKSLTK